MYIPDGLLSTPVWVAMLLIALVVFEQTLKRGKVMAATELKNGGETVANPELNELLSTLEEKEAEVGRLKALLDIAEKKRWRS